MSDEIAVMNEGRIEQVGGVTDIYERPGTEFVADFIGETNLVPGSYEEDDDGAVVIAGDNRYQVPRTEGASGEVSFAVRPEKLRLGADAEGLDNSFSAAVVDEIYKGSVGKFVVALSDGTEFTVDVHMTDESRHVSVGQSVTVGWPADQAVVLTE